jgi:hypothetical protein
VTAVIQAQFSSTEDWFVAYYVIAMDCVLYVTIGRPELTTKDCEYKNCYGGFKNISFQKNYLGRDKLPCETKGRKDRFILPRHNWTLVL